MYTVYCIVVTLLYVSYDIHCMYIIINPSPSSLKVEEIELKPNGGDIDITEDNKKEYVK